MQKNGTSDARNQTRDHFLSRSIPKNGTSDNCFKWKSLLGKYWGNFESRVWAHFFLISPFQNLKSQTYGALAEIKILAMGDLDSSYMETVGVKWLGLKKVCFIFSNTLVLNGQFHFWKTMSPNSSAIIQIVVARCRLGTTGNRLQPFCWNVFPGMGKPHSWKVNLFSIQFIFGKWRKVQFNAFPSVSGSWGRSCKSGSDRNGRHKSGRGDFLSAS